MMNRLSEEENLAKLSALKTLFEERFDLPLRSFRAGRWGFGPSVARAMAALDIGTDASVSPFMDWTHIGGPDYSRALQTPYRFDPNAPLRPTEEGRLVEVPTSVGFLRGSQAFSATVRSALERTPARPLKIVGLLDVLGVLAKRWLSPEGNTGQGMIRLARALVRSGVGVLDLTFHSPSLLPGATPFVRDDEEKARLLDRMDRFLAFCHREGYEFTTVGAVADECRNREPS
jgi:hypothetical protein